MHNTTSTAFAIDGLYAIADTASITGDIVAAVRAALAGGAKLIQYRDKSSNRARRLREAVALRATCREAGAALIINDDIELAAVARADGVHVGANDSSVAQARRRLGVQALIGVSCYDSLAAAREAVDAGADSVAFGSFFPSPTKPDAVRAPIDLLDAARELPVPVTAIGGITPDNGATLVASGANHLAVIHGVFGDDDVTAAAQRYGALFANR